jgi:hypothetical protein
LFQPHKEINTGGGEVLCVVLSMIGSKTRNGCKSSVYYILRCEERDDVLN